MTHSSHQRLTPVIAVPGAWWLARLLALLAVLAGFAPVSWAQQGTIEGRVFDSRALRPIPNVQVVVTGTNLSNSTDVQGRFKIQGVTGTEVTLSLRRIGYRPITQTARVGATDLRFEMTETPVSLDEVFVTGTAGGAEKRAIGNSVSQIRAAEIVELAPVTDIGDLITGRAPGVFVMPGSGMPGQGPRIEVRGRSTFSLKGDPLIYVDGVRVSNATNMGPRIQGGDYISRFADINPADIERIEIIKGPAAATLYGTEAASGVAWSITTGRPSRTRSCIASG